jgi:hypothetical protein
MGAVAHHQERVAEAARPHVLEERRDRLGVLLRAGHQVEQHLTTVEGEAPGGQHRLAPLPGADPLGDAVDEQIGDVVLGEIARLEGLVVLPELLADLGDRRLRQQQPPGLVLEGVLDVAHRQAPRQHLDRQALERLGVPLEMVAQRRAERLLKAGDLRGRILEPALRALQAMGPMAVAMALARSLPALVVAAIERIPHLAFQGLLDDQPGRQLDQLRAAGRRGKPPFDQRLEGFTGAHRCRYPLRHGVLLGLGPALPSPFSSTTQRMHPTPISQQS